MVKPVYEYTSPDGRQTVRVRDSGLSPETRAVIDVPRQMRGNATLLFSLAEFFANVGSEYAADEQKKALEQGSADGEGPTDGAAEVVDDNTGEDANADN